MNAPSFEMVGAGFLVIGFIFIALFVMGAIIVFCIKEVIVKCRKPQ